MFCILKEFIFLPFSLLLYRFSPIDELFLWISQVTPNIYFVNPANNAIQKN